MYLGSKPSEDRRLLTGSLDFGEQMGRFFKRSLF